MVSAVVNEMSLRWTIVTVVLNGEDFIEHCIQSVQQQSLKAQHIIQDGCSTDNTLSKVRTLIASGCENIMLESEPDLGLYDAMNKGVVKAKSEFVGILNSDDFYNKSDILETVASVFDSNPTIDLVCCGVAHLGFGSTLDRVARLRAGRFRLKDLLAGNQLPHPGIFARRNVFDTVQFDPSYKISADFKFQLQCLVDSRFNIMCTEDVGVTMRAGGISQAGWTPFLIGKREIVRSLTEVLGISTLRGWFIVVLNIFRKIGEISVKSKA